MMIPMLFNTEMVQAIQAGRKTQTRRVLKLKYKDNEAGFQILTNTHDGSFAYAEYYDEDENPTRMITPPCMPGSILWVRETWHKDAGRYMYRANYSKDEKFYRNGQEVEIRWSPSIHMPKEAARIFLRVKDVRVERVGYITASDAMAEGVMDLIEFSTLWDSTIKPADHDKYGWAADPWVWVIEFERCEKPEGWCA